jgi:hypothetical protein
VGSHCPRNWNRVPVQGSQEPPINDHFNEENDDSPV